MAVIHSIKQKDKLIILYVLNKIKLASPGNSCLHLFRMCRSAILIFSFILMPSWESSHPENEMVTKKEILTNTADGNKTLELLLDRSP